MTTIKFERKVNQNMNSIWKRSLAMLLSLVMVIGMVPVSAFADDGEVGVEDSIF